MATRNQKSISAFGRKVKALREKKGLSQYKLADEADIDRSQIINIENGTANPTLNTICALAAALEVKVRDLVEF